MEDPLSALTPFLDAIQENCDISDAQGSAIFSICGMALRLRDLNKWEKGLLPWQEDDPARLLSWIDKKEKTWDASGQREFVPLPLLTRVFDPFDTAAINQALAPLGLFYGAGYAQSLKPTFFLAKIVRQQTVQGMAVLVLEKELKRDLLTLPALNQDNCVILRQEAARLFLWDQMAYLKKSGQRFLSFGIKACGLPDASIQARKSHFEAILETQTRTCLWHEIAEIRETEFPHPVFQEMVNEFPHSTVEFLARTVRDLLADTSPLGPLARMIETCDTGALGLYAAFQDGLFRPLFPQLRPAVEAFMADPSWQAIEQARQAGRKKARTYARDLIDIFERAKAEGDLARAQTRIQETLVAPLMP